MWMFRNLRFRRRRQPREQQEERNGRDQVSRVRHGTSGKRKQEIQKTSDPEGNPDLALLPTGSSGDTGDETTTSTVPGLSHSSNSSSRDHDSGSVRGEEDVSSHFSSQRPVPNPIVHTSHSSAPQHAATPEYRLGGRPPRYPAKVPSRRSSTHVDQHSFGLFPVPLRNKQALFDQSLYEEDDEDSDDEDSEEDYPDSASDEDMEMDRTTLAVANFSYQSTQKDRLSTPRYHPPPPTTSSRLPRTAPGQLDAFVQRHHRPPKFRDDVDDEDAVSVRSAAELAAAWKLKAWAKEHDSLALGAAVARAAAEAEWDGNHSVSSRSTRSSRGPSMRNRPTTTTPKSILSSSPSCGVGSAGHTTPTHPSYYYYSCMDQPSLGIRQNYGQHPPETVESSFMEV